MSGEREELRELVRSTQALLDAHRGAGTTQLPVAERIAAPAKEPGRPTIQASEPPRHERERPPASAPTMEASAAPKRERRAPVAEASTMIPEGAEERRARLVVLASEVSGCTKCVLHETRKQTVFARGNPSAELCFIGEGPGADEDAQGFPFVGKAGQLLDRMIAAMGFERDEVYVCNIVKCRPPGNRKPEPDEMASCMPYLREQLGLVAPKVIVALGGTAVEGLLGAPVAITRARGQWRLYRGTIPLMPTFHPAYLLRNPAAKREVWTDLKSVLERLGRPVPKGNAS